MTLYTYLKKIIGLSILSHRIVRRAHRVVRLTDMRAATLGQLQSASGAGAHGTGSSGAPRVVRGRSFVANAIVRPQLARKRKRSYAWGQPGCPARSLRQTAAAYSHGEMPYAPETGPHSTAAVGRKCLFCGRGGKMSSEHLWPKWAQEAIASPQQRRCILNSLHDGPGPAYKSWYQPAFEATVKVVCPKCNNGWMSEIEAAAKPLALPLILGHSLALGPEAQQKLALWAYLKCSLFQTFEKDDRIKAAMAKAHPVFYELRKAAALAPHCSVFVARHIGLRVGQYQHRLLALSPDQPVAFVQTLTAGELVLQVVRSYLGHSPPWNRRDPRVHGCDRPIWPVSGTFT